LLFSPISLNSLIESRVNDPDYAHANAVIFPSAFITGVIFTAFSAYKFFSQSLVVKIYTIIYGIVLIIVGIYAYKSVKSVVEKSPHSHSHKDNEQRG